LAVVTGAGILKADWIIHANGPKFREEEEEKKLRSTVRSVLARAEEKGVKRLAFPPIGTGLYQVPLDLCSRVMVEEIAGHLGNGSSLDEVLIVAPDAREYQPFAARIEEGA
jgi:O-acetyl-ADP-ribose deacetylase (regulator of RNase III)